MTHPDERTIELLALRSPELQDRREELEQHFLECRGCQELYTSYLEFYKSVEILPSELPARLEDVEPSLLAQPGFVMRRGANMTGIRVRARAAWQLMRKHPIRSSGVAAAGLAAALFLLSPSRPDDVPAFAEVSPDRHELQVYDANYRTLWTKPLRVGSDTAFNRTVDYRPYYCLEDLNGDGKKELLMMLGMPGDTQAILRMFDADGNIMKALDPIVDSVEFRGRRYLELFQYASVMTSRDRDGRKSVYALFACGHSPCAIARLDKTLDVVGRYWHFGYLRALDTLDVNGDGTKEIICGGMTQDTPGEIGYPVIVALDPVSVTGECQSSATPGFGLPNAHEVAYIRLPLSDMNFALRQGAFTSEISHLGKVIKAHVVTLFAVGNVSHQFAFDFYFDYRLTLLSVKNDENVRATHTDMAEKGLVRGQLDNPYFANLKDSIRFWDGTLWRSPK